MIRFKHNWFSWEEKMEEKTKSIDIGVEVNTETGNILNPIMIEGKKITKLGIYKTLIKDIYIWVVDRTLQLGESPLKKDKDFYVKMLADLIYYKNGNLNMSETKELVKIIYETGFLHKEEIELKGNTMPRGNLGKILNDYRIQYKDGSTFFKTLTEGNYLVNIEAKDSLAQKIYDICGTTFINKDINKII